MTSACLAKVGHQVMCIDVDADKVERLKLGIIPIHEPGLERAGEYCRGTRRRHGKCEPYRTRRVLRLDRVTVKLCH